MVPNSDATLPVYVAKNAADLSLRAADLFAHAVRDAVAARGEFTVALAGGSTPELMYRDLASLPPDSSSAGIPWPAVHVFFGDERYVPHDDQQSNYRMAREALLYHVPIPDAQVHPMPTGAGDAARDAAAYEQTLLECFRGSASSEAPQAETPRLDLVLLGLGPDGHTASLFPGTDVVHEQRRLVAAPWVEKFQTFRITLTPRVLCNAREVWFLVSGAGKASILHEVLEGPFQPDRLPAQVVRPVDGTLRWLIDREAAAGLTRAVQTL